MIEERNPDPRVMPVQRRITSTQIALIIAGLLIVAFAVWTFASTRRSNPDKLPDASSVAATKAADPDKRCGSQATYDFIKRELFRRAAVLRGADHAEYGKLADNSVVRIERPLLDSADDRTSAIGCSGSLALDLPPGVAVVGGRRTLTADISYGLQRSADGNGQVLTLTGADSVITLLATLARISRSAVDPLAPTPKPQPAPVFISPPLGSPISPPPPPPPPVLATADAPRPSFNCTNARSRGEIAVCGDPGLAALDRQMAAQYADALRSADPQTRAELQRSGGRFLGYRDQCPSSACIAQTYRGRMREIRDISNGSIR